MKLFHKENGKEVVYVQRQDMVHLFESNIAFPASIYNKVFDQPVGIIDETNRFEFIKFEKESEVEFFKKIKSIIDLDDYKDLTEEQFMEKMEKMVDEANSIGYSWNAMNLQDRVKNQNLFWEREDLEYMLTFLCELFFVLRGEKTMPFPDFVVLPTMK